MVGSVKFARETRPNWRWPCLLPAGGGWVVQHMCSLCVTDHPLAGTRPFHGPDLVAFSWLLATVFGEDCRRYRRGL